MKKEEGRPEQIKNEGIRASMLDVQCCDLLLSFLLFLL